MSETPNLRLPYIAAAQAQKHVTHNEALRALDALVQLVVLDRHLTAPPSAPADGARYIVAASPTGAWAGQAGRIAAWQDEAWKFHAPAEGWVAWVADEDGLYAWDGGTWIAVSGGGGGSVNPAPLVGVNTTADATNRLAVKSDAALFSHDDVTPGSGDMRVVYNKATSADTASFLFQDGFSGRAEVGLTGDDDLHVKVSADGASWKDALIIDRTTGAVSMPFTTLSGGRETLTAARTYYVRADGSDSNTGLANTAGGAFLTIQKAIDAAASLDMGIYDVTIRVADGTYSTAQTLKTFLGSGTITIEGNTATPANVLVNPSGSCFSGTWLGKYVLKGMKLVPGALGIYVSNTGVLEFEAIDFGAASIHVLASGGQITATGNYTISGGASRHLIASGPGSVIRCSGRTITLTGTPNFTTAFAQAEELAEVRPTGNTYVGSATGKRYDATSIGLIQTNGAGTSALPGNSAGTTSNGGIYA